MAFTPAGALNKPGHQPRWRGSPTSLVGGHRARPPEKRHRNAWSDSGRIRLGLIRQLRGRAGTRVAPRRELDTRRVTRGDHHEPPTQSSSSSVSACE